MDLKLLKMRCKYTKQHHVMFHELYSVSLLLCIAQNVRFEIPYKVLYFETPFLIIFKYYAWVSCARPWQVSLIHSIRFYSHDVNRAGCDCVINECSAELFSFSSRDYRRESIKIIIFLLSHRFR